MEIDNTNTENRYRTLTNDPQYFGSYLNLARHNIYSIDNHLSKEFKQKSLLSDEGKIASAFICDSNRKNVNYNWLFEKLIRFMPVVKQFDAARLPKQEQQQREKEGKDLQSMATTLKAVFKDLQELRNDYSHYYSTVNGSKRKRVVSAETAEFIRLSFKRAIAYSKSRFEHSFSDNDFALVQKPQLLLSAGNELTTEGLVFLTSMFLDRENAFQFMGKIVGFKGTHRNSFLATRQVFMAYCVRLPHEKLVSENPINALYLDVLNELDRCPKLLYRVLNDETKKTFSPILTEESRKQVLTNSLGKDKSESDYENMEYDEYIQNLTIRIRHTNRFHYFALRFIEEKQLLPGFYFQINLGKYQLAEYPKTVAGEEVPRLLVENAKAFGRLSSFHSCEEIQQQIDSNSLAGGFEQFAPHYNIASNKIAFRFNEAMCKIKPGNSNAGVTLKQPQPMGFLSLHELGKIILIEYLEKGAAGKIMKQFLDRARMDRLLDLKFIEEVKAVCLQQEWTTFRKQYDTKKRCAYADERGKALLKESKMLIDLTERKQILDGVLAPHGLNHKQIPKRIFDYWLQIEDVNKQKRVSERILQMRRDGLRRLKQLKKQVNDAKINVPKVGEMATFIAQDLVKMVVDLSLKQKITSIYYDKLQECIAFYANPEKQQQFLLLVNELKLKLPGGHPFLGRLQLERIQKTSELYQLYLDMKVSWMSRTFETTEWSDKAGKSIKVFKIPADKKNIPYTICQWEKKEQSLFEWIEQQRAKTPKQPAELPTNLFDEKLCELLRLQFPDNDPFTRNENKYNKLLKSWWEHIRCDSVQDFYSADRSYLIKGETVSFTPGSKQITDYYQDALDRAFENLSAQRREDKKANRYLPYLQKDNIEKVFKHTLIETEKEIRIQADEDRILLLIAEQLRDDKESGSLKLSKINEALNTTQQVKRTFSFQPNFDDQGNKLTERETVQPKELIVKAEMKLKNSKNLNRFAHDRRLAEFIAYCPTQEIGANELRDELIDYNKSRSVVFDAIFELEKKIIETDREGILAQHTSLHSADQKSAPFAQIQHNLYLSWLIEKGVITENEEKYLRMIRNSFSHNQFPHRAIVASFQESIPEKKIASAIAHVYKQKIDLIMGAIVQD